MKGNLKSERYYPVSKGLEDGISEKEQEEIIGKSETVWLRVWILATNSEYEEDTDEVFENFVEESEESMPKICPLSPEYTIAEFNIKNVNAKYETRPDKFVSSVLMNGPNNQLIGLRETMFIAIKLNRSYIMVRTS